MEKIDKIFRAYSKLRERYSDNLKMRNELLREIQDIDPSDSSSIIKIGLYVKHEEIAKGQSIHEHNMTVLNCSNLLDKIYLNYLIENSIDGKFDGNESLCDGKIHIVRAKDLEQGITKSVIITPYFKNSIEYPRQLVESGVIGLKKLEKSETGMTSLKNIIDYQLFTGIPVVREKRC